MNELKAHLAACETQFNQDLKALVVKAKTPGYHTRIADGTPVRETRRNMEYALACLDSGEAVLRERANAIIAGILELQDRDPLSRTYGIWSWFIEEPLSRMSPPDWNWADFIGSLISLILKRHSGRLPEGLEERLDEALGHAARSIFRRNVDPNYTNIAIMGSGVTAFAGERLKEPWLLAYAKRRMREIVGLARFNGAFAEFNSPTYTVVAIDECERLLSCVSDIEARSLAEELREIAWSAVACHFHQPSGQWGGPHARAYSNLLSPSAAKWLQARTGARIEAAEGAEPSFEVAPPLPCPEKLRQAFQAPPAGQFMDKTRILRKERPEDSVWASFWMDSSACLGSLSSASFWTQCHPLIAYWKGSAKEAACLRLRTLKDGRDFCPGSLRSAQAGPDVLALWTLVPGTGDFHPSLDKPADGAFKGSSLKIRLELGSPDAKAERAGNGRWVLKAQGVKACVKTGDSLFDGKPIAWRVVEEEGLACLEGDCPLPEGGAFKVEALAKCSAALAIAIRGEAEEEEGVELLFDPLKGEASWPAKKLSISL